MQVEKITLNSNVAFKPSNFSQNYFQTEGYLFGACKGGKNGSYYLFKSKKVSYLGVGFLKKIGFLSFIWVPGGLMEINDPSQFRSTKKKRVSACIIGNLHPNQSMVLSKIRCVGSYQSLQLNLQDELTKTCSKNWRKSLKKSKQRELLFRIAEEKDFKQIVHLYEALQTYKKLNTQIEYKKLYFDITNSLSDTMIFVCTNHEGEVLAVRGVGVAKTNCFDIYSAISYKGKKCYAGHYLFEKVVEHLKHNNYRLYDLGGVDPKRNKAVFNFKKGTGSSVIFYEDEKVFGSFIIRLLFKALCWMRYHVTRPA